MWVEKLLKGGNGESEANVVTLYNKGEGLSIEYNVHS